MVANLVSAEEVPADVPLPPVTTIPPGGLIPSGGAAPSWAVAAPVAPIAPPPPTTRSAPAYTPYRPVSEPFPAPPGHPTYAYPWAADSGTAGLTAEVRPAPARTAEVRPAPARPRVAPEAAWLLVLDGAPGTDPGAVAGALPRAHAAYPDGLSVLPGPVGGATPCAAGLDLPNLVHAAGADSDERSRCLTQTAVLRALRGRHAVVRDWVSALAAAAAVACLDGGRLLRSRAGWAQTCVGAGLLRPADGYVILDLEPRQSMARTATAPLGDPRRDVLVAEQFRAFWLSPAAAVRGYPVLAETLRRLHIERVDGRLASSTLAQAVRETLG